MKTDIWFNSDRLRRLRSYAMISLLILSLVILDSCSADNETDLLEVHLDSIGSRHDSCKEVFVFKGFVSTMGLIEEVGTVLSEEGGTPPTVDDIKIVGLTNISSDTTFRVRYEMPQSETIYWYRTYAKVNDEYVYSTDLQSVEISNAADNGTLYNFPGSIERLSDFPGKPRGEAVAFSANGFGYVCCGFDGSKYLSDFWRYTPGTDTWDRLDDFPGSPAAFHTAVVYKDFAYVFFGSSDPNGIGNGEAFKYDLTNNKWFNLEHSLNQVGFAGISFIQEDKIYIGNLTNNIQSIIVFDPGNDSFSRENVEYRNREGVGFPPSTSSRNMAVSLNGVGYFLSNIGDRLSNYVYNSNMQQLGFLHQAFFGADDGLAFVVNDKVYVVTGRNLFSDIGMIDFNVDNGRSFRYCNEGINIERSEAVGFQFGNEIIITNGVEYNEDTNIHDNPLSSTYKITIDE